VAEMQRPRMRGVYDQLNRLKETWSHTDETDAVGVKLSAIGYDWLGRKTLETVWENASESTQKKLDYDGLGRLTRVIVGYGTADHTVTQYAYDEVGNLTTQRDGNQFDANDVMISGAKSTTFQYDGLGRRTQRMLPMGGTPEQWEYDFNEATGVSSTAAKRPNAIRHKDFTGLTTQYLTTVNDVMGRFDQKKQGSTVMVDIDYTATGLRSQMKDNTGTRTTKYIYDDLQRLRIKNMPEGTLTYDYDNAGNVKLISARRTYSNIPVNPPFDFAIINATGSDTRSTGAYMAYRLDTRGRVMRVNEDAGGANADATYSYDPVGNLARTKYRNTIQSTYAYNARNQLTLLIAGPNGGSAIASFKYDDSTWGNRQLGYTGQRRKLDETINGVSRRYEYDFDSLRRLKNENVLSGANSGVVTYDGTAGYGDIGYDKVGNRGKRDSSISGVAQRTYAPYDANDRLGNYTTPVNGQVSARFDANGNTLQFDLDATGAPNWDQSTSDTYDLENRMIGATRTAGSLTFGYDGDGKRFKKGVAATTTYFLVDDQNPTGYAQVLEESTTQGGTPAVTYVYGLDLISQTRASTTKYYGYDGLGSTRYLTQGTAGASDYGQITDTYTYDSFGIKLSNSTGSTQNSYLYAGEQLDQETGMYYLRVPRYYSPEAGRFGTKDPYEGFREVPASLHSYSYADLDPISMVDPSGNASTRAAQIAPLSISISETTFKRRSQAEFLGRLSLIF
jgi:RHS repeat-associated protein